MRTNQEQNVRMKNRDDKTITSFGHQWSVYDQAEADLSEQQRLFARYFALMNWDLLPASAHGFDMGCGSGRWAQFVARHPRVAKLVCIDPASGALETAQRNLKDLQNCTFLQASVDDTGLAAGSMDFGYALGVLHHIPDTPAAIKSCAALLKPGAPLLLYLYYRFDNKPLWYKMIWKISDLGRVIISALPLGLRNMACEIIAAFVYWPLARTARLFEKWGFNVSHWPLADYRASSFYRMRHNARDRLGTPLEQRFTRREITAMMQDAGLERITFSEGPPYWCAIGFKKAGA